MWTSPRARHWVAATATFALVSACHPASPPGTKAGTSQASATIGSPNAGASLATTATLSPSATTSPAASVTPKLANPSTTKPTIQPSSSTAAPVADPLAFTGTVAAMSAADVPFSWRPGCPIGPDQLRLLHLSYWGFDGAPHVGTMVVNTTVTGDVLKIFSRLFGEHFPIHQMQPTDVYHGSDPASMDADNTSGFNCRYAVAPGPPQWSVHAYGEAIDVNTVENPYLEGGTVRPAAGAAFVDRGTYKPGMAVPNGQLVQAFASVGWLWGGRWSAPDYQHFSKTGG